MEKKSKMRFILNELRDVFWQGEVFYMWIAIISVINFTKTAIFWQEVISLFGIFFGISVYTHYLKKNIKNELK